MKKFRCIRAIIRFIPRASIAFAGSVIAGALLAGVGIAAQGTGSAALNAAVPTHEASKPAPAKAEHNYSVHQSFDVGGHIANPYGSGAMYDTMVNMQSGPRILNQTLEVHALDGAKFRVFDTLFEDSTGYGGDPNDFSTLRMSKGKLYDFNGMFRRDRQYFDYNLFGNPLIPANDSVTIAGTGGASSYVYTYPQVEMAPHLFNTVRRMTDVNLTLFPISHISLRASYDQNVMQGPTYSSIHLSGEGLLLQNWRNSSDGYLFGMDWKPVSRTTFTYEEHLTYLKLNTNWTLAPIGLNAKLANGTPVSLGFDALPSASCFSTTSGSTTPPTVSSTKACAGYTGYNRISPTRTLFPTEEFRFQSGAIKNVAMTGRALYTGASMSMPSYYEYASGLQTRSPNPSVPTGSDVIASTITGNASARRIDTAANYGIVWQVARPFSLSEQFDFLNFHQPSIETLTENDQYGPGVLGATPVGTAPTPVVTSPRNFLGQKTESNAVTGAWDATSTLQISLGWRYRVRTLGYVLSLATDALANGRNYTYTDHQNSTLLNVALRPTPQWRVNGTVETGWADATYVQIEPRQFQHYQIRTTYRPKDWATISGAYNDTERHNNATNIGYQAHFRSFAVTTAATPNERYSFDASYGYMNAYSRVLNCFGDPLGSQPADAVQAPAGTICGNLPSGTGASEVYAWLGTSYYSAPTQYGTFSLALMPMKKFTSVLGYRVTSIGGATEMLNPLDQPGTLQSTYQSPYVNLALKLRPGWAMRGDWNYYGYGENGAAGPTAPRDFHGNVYTIGLHYEY